MGDRKKARTAYRAVDAADGDWLPPLRLRQPMAAWEFADATRAVRKIKPLAAPATALQAAAKQAGLSVSGARSAYEHATSQAALKALPTTLADTQAAVGEYAAAARAVDHLDVLGQVGARLRPGDTSLSAAAAALDKGQLSGARAAIATAQTTHQDQERTGLYAVLGAAALLLAGLAGSAWLLLRRRRRARPIAS